MSSHEREYLEEGLKHFSIKEKSSVSKEGDHSCENSFREPLPPCDEAKYLELAAKGDRQARRKLIEHNLCFVAYTVKKFFGKMYNKTYIEYSDLINIGTIGLIKAIDTYNQDRGVRLLSYAGTCINNAILMFLRAHSVRHRYHVSLESSIATDSNGNELHLEDIIGTEEDMIVEQIEKQFLNSEIGKMINDVLNERERTVIAYRYGFINEKVSSQAEIAKMLDITQGYVCRIEKRALTKLKARIK